uniref:energy-coupling factor transporter ATPase n=1 Tax=Lachnoclostridium phocaeense TaxID=1871021 RepID=UPI0026DB2229|nr:energy-coupling factor transporter ATPase [Lachnoclostridium phocaeense]
MLMEIEKLNYTYPSSGEEAVHALRDVTLSIEEGEFLALAGRSGSGKSTFVRHLNGLLRADSGDIKYRGQPIYAKKYPLGKLRQKVGLVFQYPEHQLFSRTVLDDVAFGPKNMGADKSQAEDMARKALEKVGIGEELFSSSPYELSGGQMRRVAIAGVLAMGPEVLVLDEPTAGLDPYSKRQLFALLREMQGNGTTIILVSHSMEEISEYADRVVVFLDGTVCMDGSPEDVFSQKELLDGAGLEMPQIMETLWKMQQKSIPVERLVCDEEKAAEEIFNAVTDRRGGTNA